MRVSRVPLLGILGPAAVVLALEGRAFALPPCAPSAPPASLGLDAFYAKYCSADGIPVVAGAAVSDAAVAQATRIVSATLAPLPRVRAAMMASGQRVLVIGEQQQTTDMPEYRRLPASTNVRERGMFDGGQTSSAAEENILCYEKDGWRGENILVHELAHQVKLTGLAAVDPTFDGRVKAAYDRAMAAGTYGSHYAATNPDEYWAEGVQDYFDVHQTQDPTDVNTREALRADDPALFRIVDGVFGAVRMPPACPAADFAVGAYYRLSSVRLGAGMSLDNANDGKTNAPQMAATGNYSGQSWRFAYASGRSFRMTNQFLGEGRALDTKNDGVNDPEMAKTGAYSGQMWTLAPVTGGVYRLTNAFLGPGRSLAVDFGGRLVLATTRDDASQYFAITRF
jgi:hypothetical protein